MMKCVSYLNKLNPETATHIKKFGCVCEDCVEIDMPCPNQMCDEILNSLSRNCCDKCDKCKCKSHRRLIFDIKLERKKIFEDIKKIAHSKEKHVVTSHHCNVFLSKIIANSCNNCPDCDCKTHENHFLPKLKKGLIKYLATLPVMHKSSVDKHEGTLKILENLLPQIEELKMEKRLLVKAAKKKQKRIDKKRSEDNSKLFSLENEVKKKNLEIRVLRNEIQKLEMSSVCEICEDNKTDIKLMPCTHKICSKCFEGIKKMKKSVKCPFCMRVVVTTKKI